MRFIKRHFPLIVSSIIALQYLSLFTNPLRVSWHSTPLFYPLMLYLDFAYIRLLMTTMAFPIIFLILLVVIMGRFVSLFRIKSKVKTRMTNVWASDLIALGLLAFSGLNFLLFGVVFSLGLTDSYTHHDSIQIDGTVYNLAHHKDYDDMSNGTYVLLQCGTNGWVCYAEIARYWSSDYRKLDSGKLRYNPITNTIYVVSNDRIVVTHKLAED